MKILLLVDNGYEDLEFYYPYYRLLEEGYEVVVAAPTKGEKIGKHGTKISVNVTVDEISKEQFDAVFIPGGHAPDRLRRYEEVLKVVKKIYNDGGIVGTICHGPHVLISAGIVKGVKMTSFYSIKDDLINAGAEWVDEPVVFCRRIISARIPKDLPALMRVFIKALKKASQETNGIFDVVLKDENGKDFVLSSVKGSWTVIYFFPRANTPGCTKEAQDFSNNIEFFEKKGVKIYGISADSPEKLKKFKEKYDLKVNFLSDKDKILAKKLNVLKENGGIKRSTFLINSEGEIVKEWRNVKVKGHVEDVIKEIEKLI